MRLTVLTLALALLVRGSRVSDNMLLNEEYDFLGLSRPACCHCDLRVKAGVYGIDVNSCLDAGFTTGLTCSSCKELEKFSLGINVYFLAC
jgi:hypothetical protein